MLSENDILIEEDGVRLYFRYLTWDTGFFQKPAYLLDMTQTKLASNHKSTTFFALLKERLAGAFVTAKVDTQIDYSLVWLLQQVGFYYVDTEVVLHNEIRSAGCVTVPIGDVIVDRVMIKEDIPYEDLGRSFSLTRFHADPHIDNNLADRLWIDYLKNYRIQENHKMFIARIGDEVAGVFLVNCSDSFANLFYVAVRQEFQGKGVGSALIEKVIGTFCDYSLTTETQIKNIGALNFYMKNGFCKVDRTLTVLHRWDND